MKPATVTVSYEPNEAERFAVSITVATSYPDALNEAKTTAVKAMHELMADALAQYGAASGE